MKTKMKGGLKILYLIVGFAILAIFPSVSEGQSLASDLEDHKDVFANPGESCNEVEARMQLENLTVLHKEHQFIGEDKLNLLAKLVCRNSENFEVICKDKICQCSNPTHDWDPLREQCKLKLGEACESSTECSSESICSNQAGPERLPRPEEFVWRKLKPLCIRDCIRRRCGNEDPRCSIMPEYCSAVTDCRSNPFFIPVKCVEECNQCVADVGEALPEEFRDCWRNCRSELNMYLVNIVQRDCSKKCQRNSDPVACADDCEKRSRPYKARQLNFVGCPDETQHGLCLVCVRKALLDAAPGTLFNQVRENCTRDCPVDNIEICKRNCSEFCTQRVGAETYLDCYKTIKDSEALSQVNCFNKNMWDKASQIRQDCKNICNTTSNDKICGLCREDCIQSKELGFLRGMTKIPEMENSFRGSSCNSICSRTNRYPCDACVVSILKSHSKCVRTCKDPAGGDCQTKCKSQCIKFQSRIRDAKCYEKCLENDNRVVCTDNCLKLEIATERIEEICAHNCPIADNANCSKCQELCSPLLIQIGRLYCEDNRMCYDRSPCIACRTQLASRCDEECIPPGGPTSLENIALCESTCLNVCEKTRQFFIDTQNSLLRSCSTYCKGQPGRCLLPCESYCSATTNNRCNCSGSLTSARAIAFPTTIPDDVCRNCKRTIENTGSRNCIMKLCKETEAADLFGTFCFLQCLNVCYKWSWMNVQSVCQKNCTAVSTQTKKECEQACVNKFRHDMMLTRCLPYCYNSDISSNFICRKMMCLTLCDQQITLESRLRCLPSRGGTCTDNEVKFLSEIPVNKCPDCERNVRLYYLNLCRVRCRIPKDLRAEILTPGQISIRSSYCTGNCEQICIESTFPQHHLNCRNTCQAMGTLNLNCTTGCIDLMRITNICRDKCAEEDLENSSGSLKECPECRNRCLQISYFKAAAEIKCKGCVKTLGPDTCEVCKAVRIDPICRTRCSQGPDCIANCVKECRRQRCSTYAENLKFHEAFLELCSTSIFPFPECEARCNQNNRINCFTNCIDSCNDLLKGNQKICEGDCRATGSEPMPPGKPSETAWQRPTRTPGHSSFSQHYCCFNNGRGQCNASNPNRNPVGASSITKCSFKSGIFMFGVVVAATILKIQ